jgi:hypothetical protein
MIMAWLIITGHQGGGTYLLAGNILQRALKRAHSVVFGWGDKTWLVNLYTSDFIYLTSGLVLDPQDIKHDHSHESPRVS